MYWSDIRNKQMCDSGAMGLWLVGKPSDVRTKRKHGLRQPSGIDFSLTQSSLTQSRVYIFCMRMHFVSATQTNFVIP